MLKKTIFVIFGWLQTPITYFRSKNLSTIFVFSFFFLVFLWMYMTLDTLSAGDDYFFHFRFAEQMREHGILNSFRDFKAIYFSKMAHGNEYFIYYNFLYYLIITPFTYVNPLFLGIKLYAICAASLSFTILYWVLKKLEVKGSFLWTLAVIGTLAINLVYRFFSSRPYTLAPALLLLLLYYLHKKRYFGVFTISFIYIYWHSATFFLPLIIILTHFIFEKFYGEKGSRKNLVAGIGGVLLSLISICMFTPGFFAFMSDMVNDIVSGVFNLSVFGDKVDIQEGMELYPVVFFDFVKGNYFAFSALIICTCIFVYRYVMSKMRNYDSNVLESLPKVSENRVLVGASFLLTMMFFLGMLVVSARFEDYFVFFGALFVALYVNEILSFVKINSVTISKAVVTGVFISVCYLFLSNILSIRERMSNGASVETFRPIGEWLDENVPKGEIVFNISWNWFPQLYYHSPSHNYVVGIEPRFLYTYNPELYLKWYSIGANGYVCSMESCPEIEGIKKSLSKKKSLIDKWYKEDGEQIANTLSRDFHSRYIITTKNYTFLNSVLDNSDRFVKRFSSPSDIYIYEVK